MTTASTLIEPGTVRVERLLPGPVERVWAYLTESDKRATWFAGGEFELRVGGRARLEFDHERLSSDRNPPGVGKPVFDGRITRLEPLRVLAHTMKWDSGDTEVTYELTPRGAQVLLVITHRRLGDRSTTVSVMGGWDTHTGILEDVLTGRTPRPFWTTHEKLQREYSAAI